MNHVDARHRNVELFGDDLAHGEIGSLSAVDLAEEQRDLSVTPDRQPRIEIGRMLPFARWRCSLRENLAVPPIENGDDERAGALQHRPA